MWMKAVVSPLNALATWQDRHPLATFAVGVASIFAGNGEALEADEQIVEDDSAALEAYWNSLGNRAPVQSYPYNIVNKYNVATGELKSVTTYDAFGNRAYQYEFGGRWGAEYHVYDNRIAIGAGNGPRSHPGTPF